MLKKIIAVLTLLSFLIYIPPNNLLAQESQSAPIQEKIARIPYIQIIGSPEETAKDLDIKAAKNKVSTLRKGELENIKQQRKSLEKKKEELQKELQRLHKQPDTPEIEKRRTEIRCETFQIEKTIGDDGKGGILAMQEFQKSIFYNNVLAKLDLLEKWPVEKQKVNNDIQTGKIKNEKFSDVKDIGIRGGVFNDQNKDIKKGQDAWEEARKNGDIRDEEIVKDPEILKYFESIVKELETDINVPVKIFVINKQMTKEPFVGEPEINAFALPGGILAVETGLIAYAENESELIGVITHELAHIAARHSNRITSRASVRSLLMDLGYLAMMIFTGGYGALAYAAYYGLQALGFVFTLELLGISRDFELESDTLGVQYAYASGYDPDGFLNFFDKMATKFGYAQKTSFFATHPAFSERIINLGKQSIYLKGLNLANTDQLKIDTSEFQKMKTETVKIIERAKTEMIKDSANIKRPTLMRGKRDPCPEEKPNP